MKFRILYIFILLSVNFLLQAQSIWPKETSTAKPWTRWWWMGSAVNQNSLQTQLESFNQIGLGGVEIVPIYGAVGFENQSISYLSKEWMNVLDFTVKKANEFNMGVDISLGTGWPIGGPQVNIENAATKMIVQKYEIKSGEKFTQRIILEDEKQKDIKEAHLQLATAYNDKNEAIIITDKVSKEGNLNWIPPTGNWTIYTVFYGKTLQKVKRAAPGGEGYTLDHFSKTAITHYLKTFDDAFENSNHGVRSFFNDSYEVYGANWTHDFLVEFQKRRGYDLKPFIKFLLEDENNETTRRIKSDYRQTMSDLMLENFTQKFTSWAHSKNSKNTNQAHGSPGNLLDLYAAVDIPESETFGSTKFTINGLRRDSADVRNVDPDIYMLKFASSAANVYGKKLTSNETFTWLTEHFKTSWSQAKPEVEQVFLSGINHVFYHGTTYSPNDVEFPGWLFYASVNFIPQNSLWPHLKGLNQYITRSQSILQSGRSDNELLVYWPVFDEWENPKGKDKAFKVHDIDDWLHPTSFYKNITRLSEEGFSLDFGSDKMIQEAYVKNGEILVSSQGNPYKTIIVPSAKMMPLETLNALIDLAQNGAVLIFEEFPKDVPGYLDFEKRRQEQKQILSQIHFKKINENLSESNWGKGKIYVAENVENALKQADIYREELVQNGLKFLRRKIENGYYYYIVNHSENDFQEMIPLNKTAQQVILLDPQSGKTGETRFISNAGKIQTELQLKSGQSIFIKLNENSAEKVESWHLIQKEMTPIEISGEWKLDFLTGGPELPQSKTMKTLQPWTSFTEDTSTQSFSGTAVYTTEFKLKEKNADDYILKLEKLYESAKIKINGEEVGLIWSIPYEINIGKFLKKGNNKIEIEVANLMANRIRFMDQNKMEWRNYHEINFVNIDYKKFDASNWKVQPSGLDGKVLIVPVEFKK